MRKHKKLLAITVCVLLFFNLTAMGEVEGKAQMDIYQQIEVFRSILDDFVVNDGLTELRTAATMKDGSAEPDVVFPESFGGHYYKDDQLNICVTKRVDNLRKSSIQSEQKMAVKITNESIKTKIVKYSLNDLKYVQMALGETRICDYGVTSTDIDVENNCIILNVYSENMSKNNINQLNTYLKALNIDNGMIQIKSVDTKSELLKVEVSEAKESEEVKINHFQVQRRGDRQRHAAHS